MSQKPTNNKTSMQTVRLPEWLRKKIKYTEEINQTHKIFKTLNLDTICENAKCPNLSECFKAKRVTFLILGNICTRNCKFCGVSKKIPNSIDNSLPAKIVSAIKMLKMEYVVITSVTRDDLKDFGANQFIKVIEEIRNYDSKIIIEILTPDFMVNKIWIESIVKMHPNIFSHNLEIVPRLYPEIKEKGDYKRSLKVLKIVKEIDNSIYTKSGLMLGLGEHFDEVIEVFCDLRKVKCDMVTIGQYLRPSFEQIEVKAYLKPEVFEDLKEKAYQFGFKEVVAGPFVRSSSQPCKIDFKPTI